MWGRLGPAYSPHELWDAVDEQRIIELRGTLVAEDIALCRAEMAEWSGAGGVRGWKLTQSECVKTNNACRRDILEGLRAGGPLPEAELPDTCVQPWASTGWNKNQNIKLILASWCSEGRSRPPAGRDATGCGTWRPASTPTTRRSRSRRRCGCATRLSGSPPAVATRRLRCWGQRRSVSRAFAEQDEGPAGHDPEEQPLRPGPDYDAGPVTVSRSVPVGMRGGRIHAAPLC
jgi:hypothetical protein